MNYKYNTGRLLKTLPYIECENIEQRDLVEARLGKMKFNRQKIVNNELGLIVSIYPDYLFNLTDLHVLDKIGDYKNYIITATDFLQNSHTFEYPKRNAKKKTDELIGKNRAVKINELDYERITNYGGLAKFVKDAINALL